MLDASHMFEIRSDGHLNATFPPQQQLEERLFRTLSSVTSALSRLSTCLSTLSLQINNKANVVTSPKEPVPTPSLVHCLPASLLACLHARLCLAIQLSRLSSPITQLLYHFIVHGDLFCIFPIKLKTTDVFSGCVT